jgi:hypothetical protein
VKLSVTRLWPRGDQTLPRNVRSVELRRAQPRSLIGLWTPERSDAMVARPVGSDVC